MDAFQRIAQVFKEDCIAKLKALEDIKMVVVSCETVGIAMRKLLIDPEVYPDGYSYIQTIQSEIDRYRRCIDSTEVKIQSIFQITLHYEKKESNFQCRKSYFTRARYSRSISVQVISFLSSIKRYATHSRVKCSTISVQDYHIFRILLSRRKSWMQNFILQCIHHMHLKMRISSVTRTCQLMRTIYEKTASIFISTNSLRFTPSRNIGTNQ